MNRNQIKRRDAEHAEEVGIFALALRLFVFSASLR